MSVSRWIGDYEIVRRLRVGGMATLYLARLHGAAGFSRLAAIKVIHPHLVEQPQFVEMFVDEARISSYLSHPNIVHVEEFGERDGTYYLVMEYIDGCSATDLLNAARETGGLDPKTAAHVVMYTARGLHAAHEAHGPDGAPLDLIHRDISPSNILISTAGNVKLIDFGIAKARNRVTETESGFAMKGKYRYVAPEQAKRTDLDRRSDIFSLGVVFWELLTGKPLFADDTQVALFNRLEATVVEAPSSVDPRIPAVLDPIVLGMLQHDPQRRPQTALEVYRQIAVAMPEALMHDTASLGEQAVIARDKRTRSTESGDNVGSNPSFSSTPQPRRSQLIAIPIPPLPTAQIENVDYQVEVEPVPVAPPPVVAPHAPRSRRGLYLAIGGVGVAAVIAILLSGRSGTEPRVDNPPSPAAPAPSVAATPPAPPPAAPPPVEPVVATPPVVSATPPPVASTPPAPVAAVPRPAVAPLVRPGPVPRAPAALARTVPVPRAETPLPAAKARTIRSGKSTFVDAAFDDAGNTTTNRPATRDTIKKTKTTIVTDFEN
jgi:serine/threonine protein kinase